jgi:hypothetical protein
MFTVAVLQVGQHVQELSLDLPSRAESAQREAQRLGNSQLKPKLLRMCTIGEDVAAVLATQEIAPAFEQVKKLDMRFLDFSAGLCQVCAWSQKVTLTAKC